MFIESIIIQYDKEAITGIAESIVEYLNAKYCCLLLTVIFPIQEDTLFSLSVTWMPD
jgi:hypothetical protein